MPSDPTMPIPLRPAPLWRTLLAVVLWHVAMGLAGMVALELGTRGIVSGQGATALAYAASLAVLAIPVLRAGLFPALLRRPMRSALLWLVVLAAVLAANRVMLALSDVPVNDLAPQGLAAQGPREAGWFALQCAAIALGAPLVEEHFYRGWLWQRLAPHWPGWAVAAATGAIFALAHAQFALSVLPIAIGLSLLRLHDGGLRAPLALHAAMNIMAVAVLLTK